MRVGITGASGFIGSALVEALEKRGDEIIRFVRPGSVYQQNVVHWNPSTHDIDENDLRRVRGFDAVVHLAGAGVADKRWTSARKNEILTSRTNATSLLVEALGSLPSGTGVLASGSAIGFYGSRGEESLTEASAPGDDFLATVCVEWENAANVAVKSGTPVAILRTGIVMDKSGGALKKQLPVFRLGLGGKLGSGAQWLSPISLNDEIRAILWVLDNKLSGPFNLTSPKPLRNIDFTKQLGDALHRPTIVTAPAFALRIALGREMADEVLLTSQKVLPEALLESGFIFNDSESASMLQQ
jgi:uncharacterized protein (TIGR01777 family)